MHCKLWKKKNKIKNKKEQHTYNTGAFVSVQLPARLAVTSVVPGPQTWQQAQLSAQVFTAWIDGWIQKQSNV